MLTLLQLSWLSVVLSRRRTVRPDHEPTTPGPAGTTMAPDPAPPMAKSASVHAGLVGSVCTENGSTTAVTELMCTACGLGLVNVPDNDAAGPPGYSPVGDP